MCATRCHVTRTFRVLEALRMRQGNRVLAVANRQNPRRSLRATRARCRQIPKTFPQCSRFKIQGSRFKIFQDSRFYLNLSVVPVPGPDLAAPRRPASDPPTKEEPERLVRLAYRDCWRLAHPSGACAFELLTRLNIFFCARPSLLPSPACAIAQAQRLAQCSPAPRSLFLLRLLPRNSGFEKIPD